MTATANVRSLAYRSILVALLAIFMIGLAAPRVESAPPSDAGEQALLADFGSCLAGGSTGSIVLLIDQSGSLEATDPDGARMQGAKFLIERLADFSTTSGYSLDVRVAGFAAAYETPGDWEALDEGSVASLESQIDTVGGDLRTHDTDYWVALESARMLCSLLVQRRRVRHRSAGVPPEPGGVRRDQALCAGCPAHRRRGGRRGGRCGQGRYLPAGRPRRSAAQLGDHRDRSRADV